MGQLFNFLSAILVILVVIFLLSLLTYLVFRFFGREIMQLLEHTFPQLIQRIRRTFPEEFNMETVRALLLVIVLLALILLLSFFGSQVLFHGEAIGIDPYLIAPLAAVIMITTVGSIFIQNVYEIRFRDALYYTLVSIYRIFMPRVVIDHGRIYMQRFRRNIEVMPPHSSRLPSAAADDIINERYNTIVHIGGPGLMVVQPGNACVTNKLRCPSQVGITRSVELRRFERIGFIAELDDQHDKAQNIEAITLDGIRVVCPEVNFRYRIILEKGHQRTIHNPFPFDKDAMRRMTYNLPVDDTGNRRDIHFQVRIAVSTAVRGFINNHPVDYLTAPREGSLNVRAEIRAHILNNIRIWMMGVELILLDIGHIQVAEAVHQSRLNAWAAEWIGDADIQRAYADGTQHGLEELGRAQAQAEMILSIISGLKSINLADDSLENVRNIFLTRVSMILDAMRANQKQIGSSGLITTPRKMP